MNTNFKNLSKGLLAAAFGLALVITGSAFKESGNAKRTQYSFHYNGPATMTVAQVTDESNWIFDADELECPSGNDEACAIRIDAAYVNNPSVAPTLNSSANLAAALSSTGKAYITGSADVSIQKLNKEQ